MIWSISGSPCPAAENLQLKRRVAELEKRAQSPISVDPQAGEIHVDHFSLGPLTIEKLDLHSQALAGAANDLNGNLTNLNPDSLRSTNLKDFTDKPILVRALKAQIPIPFINSIIDQVAGEQLRKHGLHDVRLSQSDDGLLTVRGKSSKGLPLPFEVTGNLQSTTDGKLSFHIKRSRLGIIPVPNALVALASKIAGDHLEKAGVAAEGQDFVIDPKQYKPDNLFFQLKRLEVADGAILLEGGSPVVSRPSSIPKIPRKVAR